MLQMVPDVRVREEKERQRDGESVAAAESTSKTTRATEHKLCTNAKRHNTAL
jgi:hypothetical protein